jgi:hypothetical protein
MSEPIRLVFLGSTKKVDLTIALHAILQATSELGFEFAGFKVQSAAGEQFSWGATANKAEVIAKALEFESLSFRATRETITPFVLTMQFALGWGKAQLGDSERLWVDVFSPQVQMFVDEHFHPEVHSRLLLDYGKALFAILIPTFGWLDIGQAAGYTWYTDLEDDTIKHLYWANFFSLAYVEKIGRDKILSAPAWSIEELADGGLLYVLSSSPGLADEGHVSLDAVKAHFGLQSVR